MSGGFVLFCKKECKLLRALENCLNTIAYRQKGICSLQPLVFRLFPGQCERRVSEEVMAQKKVPKGFYWNQREGCNICVEIREVTQIEQWGLWERYFWLRFEFPCYRCRNNRSMLGREVESQGNVCKSVPGRMHGEVFQHGSNVDCMVNSGFFWSRWRVEKL